MANSKCLKPSVFHMERNVIITANEKINGPKLEKFLLNHLDKFQEKTNFIVLSGHHHEKIENNTMVSVEVGKTDSSLIGGFNSTFERLFQHLKSENCNKTLCIILVKFMPFL